MHINGMMDVSLTRTRFWLEEVSVSNHVCLSWGDAPQKMYSPSFSLGWKCLRNASLDFSPHHVNILHIFQRTSTILCKSISAAPSELGLFAMRSSKLKKEMLLSCYASYHDAVCSPMFSNKPLRLDRTLVIIKRLTYIQLTIIIIN